MHDLYAMFVFEFYGLCVNRFAIMWLARSKIPNRDNGQCALPFGPLTPSVIHASVPCAGARCSASPVAPGVPPSIRLMARPGRDQGRYQVRAPSWAWMGQASSSADIQARRQHVQSQVNSCFAAAWEPSTRRRYSSGVRITVQAAEEQLEGSLLPMDNFDKFIVVFGRTVGQAWSTIRVNKSAIRA